MESRPPRRDSRAGNLTGKPGNGLKPHPQATHSRSRKMQAKGAPSGIVKANQATWRHVRLESGKYARNCFGWAESGGPIKIYTDGD